jgi:hypothetical protein
VFVTPRFLLACRRYHSRRRRTNLRGSTHAADWRRRASILRIASSTASKSLPTSSARKRSTKWPFSYSNWFFRLSRRYATGSARCCPPSSSMTTRAPAHSRTTSRVPKIKAPPICESHTRVPICPRGRIWLAPVRNRGRGVPTRVRPDDLRQNGSLEKVPTVSLVRTVQSGVASGYPLPPWGRHCRSEWVRGTTSVATL